MNLGDFSELAKYYINRPSYNPQIINAVAAYIESFNGKISNVVEVGAGTGKFTEVIALKDYSITAVEPNDEMRTEGINYIAKYSNVKWQAGSGEETGADSNSADWLIMASSFHWTNPEISLPEFHRVLRKNAFFTAIWNPRNTAKSEFHAMIEDKIYEICPHIKRVSSGDKKHTKDWFEVLVSTGHFKDVILMEVDDIITMTPQRYVDIWRSVNDIRVQAGNKWETVLNMIENESSKLKEITTPYKTGHGQLKEYKYGKGQNRIQSQNTAKTKRTYNIRKSFAVANPHCLRIYHRQQQYCISGAKHIR